MTPRITFKLNQPIPTFIFEGKVDGNMFNIICYERLPGRKERYEESEFAIYVWGIGYVKRIKNSGLFYGSIEETENGSVVSGYFGISRGIKYSLILFLVILVPGFFRFSQGRFEVSAYDIAGTVSALFLVFVGLHYFLEASYRKAILDFLRGLFEDVLL